MARLAGKRWEGARQCLLSLIGSFAESPTYVCRRRVRDPDDRASTKLRFEVGPGELAPDTRFAPHAHVVVIDVAGLCRIP